MKKGLLILLSLYIVLTAQTVLVLRSADYNSNRLIDGSVLTTLIGNVEFQYGPINIKADSTIWQRGNGHLRLGGSVQIKRHKQTLTCDSLRFTSEVKMFELRGNTKMVDSSREVTLTAKEADFFIEEDSLELRYDPKVYFWSSDNEDTVVVTGEPMHYLGETGTARVAKNITIDGRDIHAKANSGFYSVEQGEAELRGKANADYALSKLSGELIRLYISEETADSFTVVQGTPLGVTKDTLAEDTTVHRLTGDSLHFTIDSNRIERIVAVGEGKMESFSPAREGYSDIVWGDRVVANIEQNGDGKARAEGHARSLYRSDKDMQNEIAGDSLFLRFTSEGVQEITLTGTVQGLILPHDDDSE